MESRKSDTVHFLDTGTYGCIFYPPLVDYFLDPEYRSIGWLCDNKNTHESHCI